MLESGIPQYHGGHDAATARESESDCELIDHGVLEDFINEGIGSRGGASSRAGDGAGCGVGVDGGAGGVGPGGAGATQSGCFFSPWSMSHRAKTTPNIAITGITKNPSPDSWFRRKSLTGLFIRLFMGFHLLCDSWG